MKLTKKRNQIAEINVTPFVDVVLVLLVIFMITAPIMYTNILLRLPQTKKVEKMPKKSDLWILSYSREGEYFFNGKRIELTTWFDEIQNTLKDNPDQVLYLKADKDIKYGNVAQLMALLKNKGVLNIALVTEGH